MGLLVDGIWHDQWYDTTANGGAFKREQSRLRHWITANGEPSPAAPTQEAFLAESGRYHLYVSLACPWAHRTLVFRQLKGLEQHITVSVVSPDMGELGWTFDRDAGSDGDDLYGFQHLHQIYTLNQTKYTGRVTVPVLWDKKTKRIVSNESAEIIRMFNSAFNHITGNEQDFYPSHLRPIIHQINDTIYEAVNNGVYRAGFATSQHAYETAYTELFAALDETERRLTTQRYLAGNTLTEADIRLWTTLIRFDTVYHGHFKCNRQRLEDFPNLSNYTRELYQLNGVAKTVNFDQIKRHYYASHRQINPTGIVPSGPDIDFNRSHNRTHG
ncbi:glutathione S-transferase family protein [Echinimonas agarilytica]|uniref:Glutathione S-transferase family protein n=1 Tax=Echinimonas agarilytica TaxID=1215918 RepID=A0AA41W7H9_9GAMM|nr:glutathione S-transferase family protein [Echinimonas agarilytica]MCM2680667.1 glutathione S-transferase family protein [Echinimonas agarilytica]